MDEEPGGTESLFEEFLAEAVPPFLLELPDGDATVEWTIRVPSADAVCELDYLTRPSDVVAELVGDDAADDVLDLLDPLPWARTLQVATDLREHFALPVLGRGLWTFLVEQIDLYGEDIDADLFDRGHDLLDWFRGRRPWPQLSRLLLRLPEASRYKAAILDDEDLARERLLRSSDDGEPRKSLPPLVGETQDRMLLRAAVSALLRVEHAIYASQAPKGKAGRPPRPLPGPETAEDRLREEFAQAEVEDIFDQVTPGWRGEKTAPAAPVGFSASSSGLYVPTD